MSYVACIDCVSEREAKLKEEEERQRLEDMSEDEYDALTDKEKADVDKKRLEIKKERLKRYSTSSSDFSHIHNLNLFIPKCTNSHKYSSV